MTGRAVPARSEESSAEGAFRDILRPVFDRVLSHGRFAMRSVVAGIGLLILSSGLALALPPQWQIKYCHSYADNAVAVNKTRLASNCHGSIPQGDRWSNNWNLHYSWCLNLHQISDAQREVALRYDFLKTHCG